MFKTGQWYMAWFHLNTKYISDTTKTNVFCDNSQSPELNICLPLKCVHDLHNWSSSSFSNNYVRSAEKIMTNLEIIVHFSKKIILKIENFTQYFCSKFIFMFTGPKIIIEIRVMHQFS